MRRLVFALLAITGLASRAYALDPQKCFKVTHGDGLIKYDFPGYSSSEYMTKKYGSTGGVSQYSSQSSTASVDPFVTTGHFTSTTQFSSSEGGCSYYSYNRQKLKEYLSKNREFLLDQIAEGHGEHLRSIYYYSSCGDGGLAEFEAELQRDYLHMRRVSDSDAMVDELDGLILRSNKLHALCDLGMS